MDISNTNAVAGPSRSRSPSRPTSPTTSPAAPQTASVQALFLPPPGPLSSKPYLASTQDLLGKFRLLEAYDKYVEPFGTSSGDSGSGLDNQTSPAPMANPMTPGGSMDKGKGKEVVVTNPVHAPQTPAADAQDGDDEDGGKGDKKKKNSYKHLIKGVPGKHSMKKDDYLTMMMQVPPKQRMRINPFDLKTQREAFTVSLEGLKGWNPSALILESAQAREDRKKRKELKRLAKAQTQVQTAIASAPTPTSSSHPQPPPLQTPIPTSATSAFFPRSSTPTSATLPRGPTSSTPRPTASSTPRPHPQPSTRPGSTKPVLGLAPVHVPGPGARVGTPLRTGTPTGPHPLSAPPYSASSLTSAVLPGAGGGQMQQEKRGKKRERDESGGGSGPGVMVNGITNNNISINNFNNGAGPENGIGGVPHGGAPMNGVVGGGVNSTNAAQPKAIIGARAGLPGVRPRPVKKQRMDMQGQSRDTAPVQQPTPQGV